MEKKISLIFSFLLENEITSKEKLTIKGGTTPSLPPLGDNTGKASNGGPTPAGNDPIIPTPPNDKG